MIFIYLDGEQVKIVDCVIFVVKYKVGEIDDQILVFDMLVDNKSKFEKSWLKFLGESWYKWMV